MKTDYNLIVHQSSAIIIPRCMLLKAAFTLVNIANKMTIKINMRSSNVNIKLKETHVMDGMMGTQEIGIDQCSTANLVALVS